MVLWCGWKEKGKKEGFSVKRQEGPFSLCCCTHCRVLGMRRERGGNAFTLQFPPCPIPFDSPSLAWCKNNIFFLSRHGRFGERSLFIPKGSPSNHIFLQEKERRSKGVEMFTPPLFFRLQKDSLLHFRSERGLKILFSEAPPAPSQNKGSFWSPRCTKRGSILWQRTFLQKKKGRKSGYGSGREGEECRLSMS